MTRQISFNARGPSLADLERRIRELEARLAALSEAVELLTHAFGGGPPDRADEPAVARAAREVQALLAGR